MLNTLVIFIHKKKSYAKANNLSDINERNKRIF